MARTTRRAEWAPMRPTKTASSPASSSAAWSPERGARSGRSTTRSVRQPFRSTSCSGRRAKMRSSGTNTAEYAIRLSTNQSRPRNGPVWSSPSIGTREPPSSAATSVRPMPVIPRIFRRRRQTLITPAMNDHTRTRCRSARMNGTGYSALSSGTVSSDGKWKQNTAASPIAPSAMDTTPLSQPVPNARDEVTRHHRSVNARSSARGSSPRRV